MPLVEIRLLEGRSTEQKRKILEAVTEAVRVSAGAPLERIRVWISEMPPEHYMVAGVTAAERVREALPEGNSA